MLLLLLIVAPILQIVLSILKISGRINMHLSIIASIAFALGIILSISAMQFVTFDIEKSEKFKCGTPAFAALVVGVFITLIATPVIWLIGYLTQRIKNHLTKNSFSNP